MRWPLPTAVAVLLLAGCTSAPAAPDAAPAAGPSGEGRTARPSDLATVDGHGRFDAAFRLTVNPDDSPLGLGSQACVLGQCRDFRDCIAFSTDPDPPSFTATNVTAELSWTSQDGLAKSLTLKAGGTEAHAVSGPSPLALQVPALAPREGFPDFWFVVQNDPSDPPVLQEVDLRLVFDFQGELPAPTQEYCRD